MVHELVVDEHSEDGMSLAELGADVVQALPRRNRADAHAQLRIDAIADEVRVEKHSRQLVVDRLAVFVASAQEHRPGQGNERQNCLSHSDPHPSLPSRLLTSSYAAISSSGTSAASQSPFGPATRISPFPSRRHSSCRR